MTLTTSMLIGLIIVLIILAIVVVLEGIVVLLEDNPVLLAIAFFLFWFFVTYIRG